MYALFSLFSLFAVWLVHKLFTLFDSYALVGIVSLSYGQLSDACMHACIVYSVLIVCSMVEPCFVYIARLVCIVAKLKKKEGGKKGG